MSNRKYFPTASKTFNNNYGSIGYSGLRRNSGGYGSGGKNRNFVGNKKQFEVGTWDRNQTPVLYNNYIEALNDCHKHGFYIVRERTATGSRYYRIRQSDTIVFQGQRVRKQDVTLKIDKWGITKPHYEWSWPWKAGRSEERR